MTAYNLVAGNLGKLTRNELENVADLVAALLAELPEDPAAEQDAGGPAGQGASGGKGSKGGAWLELRTINGCGPYVYRRWREGGRKKSEYVGKAQTK